jgi:hypothetical protein
MGGRGKGRAEASDGRREIGGWRVRAGTRKEVRWMMGRQRNRSSLFDGCRFCPPPINLSAHHRLEGLAGLSNGESSVEVRNSEKRSRCRSVSEIERGQDRKSARGRLRGRGSTKPSSDPKETHLYWPQLVHQMVHVYSNQSSMLHQSLGVCRRFRSARRDRVEGRWRREEGGEELSVGEEKGAKEREK